MTWVIFLSCAYVVICVRDDSKMFGHDGLSGGVVCVIKAYEETTSSVLITLDMNDSLIPNSKLDC